MVSLRLPPTKLKIRKYAHLRIFNWTTCQSTTDYQSRFEMRRSIFIFEIVFLAFWSIFKKVKKMDFLLYFNILVPGVGKSKPHEPRESNYLLELLPNLSDFLPNLDL